MCCCSVPTKAVNGPRHPSHTRPLDQVFIALIVLLVGLYTICCVPAAGTRGPVSIHRVRAVTKNSRRRIVVLCQAKSTLIS